MRPKRRTAGQGGYGYGCSLSSTRHKRSPRAVGVGGERFVGEREKRMERELAGMEGTPKMRERVCVAESRRWMAVAIRDWMIRSTEETKKKLSMPPIGSLASVCFAMQHSGAAISTNSGREPEMPKTVGDTA